MMTCSICHKECDTTKADANGWFPWSYGTAGRSIYAHPGACSDEALRRIEGVPVQASASGALAFAEKLLALPADDRRIAILERALAVAVK
jgi:hypothetical protein